MESRTRAPDFDPAGVAEEYLALVPSHRRCAPVLTELAKFAWDGSWPGLFYQDLASFLTEVPWLADRWIDAESIKALRDPPLPDDFLMRARGWEAPNGVWRRRTQFGQFEGLVLLAALKHCTAAQAQLARALDVIREGLTSDRRGTAKRAKRRHPLKSVLIGLGRPQSMAALAEALSKVIPQVWVLYPLFGRFLAEAVWPLVTDQRSIWCPPQGA